MKSMTSQFRLVNNPPPFKGPSHITWLIEDQPILIWLLKLEIPSISELMHLITPTKAIWDERASMYDYESNISWIVEVYKQLFKSKQSGCHLEDYYVSIHGLLTQLELYKPYMIDLMTQHRYPCESNETKIK